MGCFCFREVLDALSAPTPLPALKPIPQPVEPETPPLEDKLVSAVEAGDLELVDLLVKAGADPATRSTGGLTALASAATSGQQEIFASLLASAAGFHARNDSRLDLHFSNYLEIS